MSTYGNVKGRAKGPGWHSHRRCEQRPVAVFSTESRTTHRAAVRHQLPSAKHRPRPAAGKSKLLRSLLAIQVPERIEKINM